jgi:hypothetical protein
MASQAAAGLTHLPATATAFAATQAAWRFSHNERLTLPALVEPLHQAARQALAERPAPCALLVHDWSKIDYHHHTTKRDQAQLTHERDRGYEMATALLVCAHDGSPLAPMQIELTTADAVHSTRDEPTPQGTDHLDQVLPAMHAAGTWGLATPLAHVIDREADSVGHYRAWDEAGFRSLVRADDRRVLWPDQERLLTEVAEVLQTEGAFHVAREVLYHGQAVRQEVAETEVGLHRPARTRGPDGKQRDVPGRPLPLRLVVVRLRDEAGSLVAEWLLLSNVPAAWATAATLALWYYWRWRIESYHKLLKGHGLAMEGWRQQTGAAIACRLLVAAMACVVVWQLQRATTPEAEELKAIVIRLSGRQMKTGQAYTAPALLAGLHVLLAMLSLLDHYDLEQLRQLVRTVLPAPPGG